MELTNIQKQIVTTDKSKVLVSSSAAAGKTACLVERLKYLLEQGVDPSKIVAITFTNNAASEMYKRLGNPNGLFIGTVHSYCNYLLRGGAVDTTTILSEERFDDLFKEIKENPQCIKHVTHLISDESQDISRNQFEFYEMINPDNYMYFFDIKQTLFSWRGADPAYLIQLSKQPDVTVYSMTQNFRNNADILRFAKRFLYRLGPDYEDNSIAMRGSDDKLHILECKYDPNDAADTLIKVSNQLGAKWGDWFVLCRSNSDVDIFKNIFNKKEIPTDSFKQADLTNSQIEKKMKENTIKILTVHSAKGMEAPYVMSYNVLAYNDDEAKVCYVAATRAKDFLIWAKRAPKRKKKSTGITNWE